MKLECGECGADLKKARIVLHEPLDGDENELCRPALQCHKCPEEFYLTHDFAGQIVQSEQQKSVNQYRN